MGIPQVKASYKVNPKMLKKKEAKKQFTKKVAAAPTKSAFAFFVDDFKPTFLEQNPVSHLATLSSKRRRRSFFEWAVMCCRS